MIYIDLYALKFDLSAHPACRVQGVLDYFLILVSCAAVLHVGAHSTNNCHPEWFTLWVSPFLFHLSPFTVPPSPLSPLLVTLCAAVPHVGAASTKNCQPEWFILWVSRSCFTFHPSPFTFSVSPFTLHCPPPSPLSPLLVTLCATVWGLLLRTIASRSGSSFGLHLSVSPVTLHHVPPHPFHLYLSPFQGWPRVHPLGVTFLFHLSPFTVSPSCMWGLLPRTIAIRSGSSFRFHLFSFTFHLSPLSVDTAPSR